MQITRASDGTILIDGLHALDRFVASVTEIIERSYVIVSGYVAILFGRPGHGGYRSSSIIWIAIRSAHFR